MRAWRPSHFAPSALDEAERERRAKWLSRQRKKGIVGLTLDDAPPRKSGLPKRRSVTPIG